VAVAGPVSNGVAPPGATPITALDSPPIGHLLARMLLLSDNQVAESLTREAGVELADVGSTPAGTAALEARLVAGCAPIEPDGWADGSGLSRSDLRSARELRRIVQHARTEPWWPDLLARLPVAGRSGTLTDRFRGTAAEGRVSAKTGTIIGGSSLTGVVTTPSGRTGVFSVIVHGDGAPAAIDALDELVVALARAAGR
jgi:D-alanyl-D-alanine carboxypeptidase/D-alanyl-D-alanine-endopeptidase (penicillin-binding protein 4)